MEQTADGRTPLVMTPALEDLNRRLEYFIGRKETSLFFSEQQFYAEKIEDIQNQIERLILEQIDQA